MRIAIVGGGPGGLYFAALMKGLDRGHEVTVWERNAPDDTFGFGVVFSDETLGGIETADTAVYRQMEGRFARWTDIDVRVKEQTFTIGGQGFAAMSRKELLRILQERVAELGVTVHYRTEAPDVEQLRASYDLVLGADGINSAIRARYAESFRPSLDRRHNKYIWLGTDLVFEAFQFFVKQTEWGTMQIHGYPYSGSGSTFIVEMHEDVWRRAGLDRTENDVFPPGASDAWAARWVDSTTGLRSAWYASSASVTVGCSCRHAARASASSIASLVPEPIEKCAVWAASPMRTRLPSCHRSLRTVWKLTHFELLVRIRCPRSSSAKISLIRSTACSSLTPGAKTSCSVWSSPARRHTSECISTMKVEAESE